MKKIISSYHWIIALATLTLVSLGAIQINWIWQAYQLKQEQIHHQLKSITDDIAVHLKIDPNYNDYKIKKGEEPIIADSVEYIVDSIMMNSGFSNQSLYAIFQEKEVGIYNSNSSDKEKTLRDSPYKTCLSCILTISYAAPDSVTPTTPEMTFIRSVSEMKKLPGAKSEEDFLWLSIHYPQQGMLSQQSIMGLFILTILLMLFLIGLFAYTLRALARQKKINQVKEDFFNNMTHEFKTPLSSIRLASTVLKQTNDENKKDNYLNLISNESKKLEGQVDKILQLALIDSKQIGLEKEKVDLHKILQEVLQRLDLIIEQKSAQVSLSLELSEPFLLGDQGHLSNCFYNLIENALKYSGDLPNITISTFRQKGKKIISIKDQGVGIPKEFQEEIFDRFFRVQKNDQYKGKGFGIGLSYVQSIVQAHKGTIILNNKYNNGCEFIIEF